jgi:hypothetical protein
MALRFKRTIDEAPHMFSTREHADGDWLLYCGGWQVGRVHMPGGLKRDTFAWSLTGPHETEAPVRKRGEAATVAQAKQQLVNAMRAWAVWAGVRTADGGGPVAPHWVLTKDHRPQLLRLADDQTTDWLLLSGGFLACAERVFDRLAALTHGLRIRIKALLHGVEQMLVLPARDPPLRPRRALGFERAVPARGCPVAPHWSLPNVGTISKDGNSYAFLAAAAS